MEGHRTPPTEDAKRTTDPYRAKVGAGLISFVGLGNIIAIDFLSWGGRSKMLQRFYFQNELRGAPLLTQVFASSRLGHPELNRSLTDVTLETASVIK